MIRRLVDVIVAFLGLAVLSPVLLLIAILVRIDSPGSPLYGGWRVGKDGRRFRTWKCRTMVRDADRLGPGITAKGDARVTRIGAYLRRTKLDELPQLFNLLTGELTLVGPRAEVPEFVARYTPEQRQILTVKPGITGPGQLYYTTDQEQSMPDTVAADDYYVQHLMGPKLRIDLDYVRRQNAGSDVRVVLDTIGVVWKAVMGH